MKIKNLDFGEAIVCAPLAGYSDVGFRSVCSNCGSDAVFTEMLSAQAMLHDSKKTKDMTIREQEEKIVFAQIFGSDPLVCARAVENPILSKFEGIDINMGCPAPKIVKNGEGSALLKNLPLASRIISSCVAKAGERPVSVKVRLGYNSDNISQIVRAAEESGASFITIHGRTYEQGFSGEVNLEAIARAKAISHIPVFGNGDVVDLETLKKMRQTKVDGVMIGRGAVGAPWVFSVLKHSANFNEMALVKKHIEILRKHYPENWLNKYLRKHFLAYAVSFKCSAEVKRRLAVQTDIDESLKLLQESANILKSKTKSVQ